MQENVRKWQISGTFLLFSVAIRRYVNTILFSNVRTNNNQEVLYQIKPFFKFPNRSPASVYLYGISVRRGGWEASGNFQSLKFYGPLFQLNNMSLFK